MRFLFVTIVVAAQSAFFGPLARKYFLCVHLPSWFVDRNYLSQILPPEISRAEYPVGCVEEDPFGLNIAVSIRY